MRSIVRGVVALVAAFCIINAVKAAPTIVSPAENAEVKTISDKIWNDIHNDSIYLSQATFYEGTHTGTYRKSAMADVNTNSVPIKLKWSGTSGECTVKIWRTRDLTANSSASPIFSTKVTGTTATYWDPEVGRNFTWSVTDSTGASVTGHFHTIQRTPRIIYGDQNPNTPGAECSAGRDIGGWLTEDKTKRVRQGLVFRSAQIEYCSSGADDHVYYPLTYLKDVIGIKLDIDLREDSHLGKYYAYPTNKVWTCSWKKGNADYSEEYLLKAESNIGPGVPRYCVDTSYAAFPSYTGFTSNTENKKSVWAAFKQIHDRVTKTNPEAVLFHCSHGKDRTGSLAYVLLGALGVSEKDARRDFGFTWYLEAKSDVAMDTAGGDGYEGLTKLLNALPSGSTFKARCVAYLKACGTAAGDSDPEGKITAFQNAMLEAVEHQEDVYELPKEDSFTYNELYWRRKDGGGTFGSQRDSDNTLNYWYKTSTSTTANQVPSSWLDYNACYYFWPVSSLPWATPSCSYYKAGKIVSVCKSTSFTIEPYGLKAYFTDVDHTVSDRTIIEHREGLAHFDNFDIYFTKYDRTTTNSDGSLKYGGETGNKTLPSVYSGVGSLDVWANATFRASDMRDMSIYAAHSSINKKPKLYLKFPSGNCNNARFEAVNGNDVNTYLGWFTGGDAGTKQYIKVEDSFLHFKSSDKVNGVAGVLGLEFTLGSKNTTSSAAMMQIAGSLKINSGSTITVNAGGKGAGTYKLITTTGSLTDNANLTSYSTYKVTNCASGCYGTIIKNSTGKTVSVKIVKGTDPNEGTGGDVVEPETPTIEDIGIAQNGDWGYRVDIGNDVAIVFTNHNKTVNWTVPNTVKNVRYLVVAGGGGGGADFNTESGSAPFQGGAGGGGGAVIEGIIPELSKSSILTITVGAGGIGGVTSIDNSDNGGIGAAASGSPSIVKLDTADYIIAYGGGGDGGTSDESSKTGNVGKSGGSSAGSRPGQTEVAEITPSYIHESLAATSVSYGNKGGAGYYVATPDNNNTWWGYVAAAGGGGGATSVGADATSSSKPGDGGSGLTSDITGSNLVYGSGGGAGTISGATDVIAGKGGSGAGDGATGGNAGGNALANQGGGGGGGARKAAGGNGGSGIVVIRYSTVTGPINPTEYGTADSAASTYTWIGYTGPWMYTTNWTATASGTHGVPNNGTYATADFPATLVNAFTCTLNQSVAVNKAEFNSPNMTFVLDNALLTLKGKVDSYAACDFGDGENDNSTIELRGANAGIVSDTKEVRLNFGYRHDEATPTGTVTVRFAVPETGWESDARLKATGTDSKVVLYANSKLEIDATALGVPAEGTTKTVYLASGTGDDGVYVLSGETNIVCAAGAKGSIKIENKKLVLTVEPDPEGTQPPSAGDWSEMPSLSTNIFNAGTSINVFNGMCGNRTVTANYTAADIAALAPGTYTFRATASADNVESLVCEIDFWVLPADFSATNTIVCYGDSITYGAGAAKITVDGRENYFDGRMKDQTIEGNYPYYLAGIINSKYNVINQGTPQQWSDTILTWLGGVDTVSRFPVTLPANGEDTWAPTNIIFTADNPYGVEGGLHFVRTIQYPPYVNGKRNPNHPLNYFAGLATTMYPAFETYPEPSGINGSMTGWFGNKRVRIHGVKDADKYFSGDNPNGVYCTDHRWQRVSTEGNATTIPANTPFIPDTAIIFKDAISVIYTGTNDEMGKETYNNNKDPDIDHNTYIKMIAGTIAKNPSGRHLVVSTLSLNQRSDESEAAFAKEFGEKYLNLHGMMERYGTLVADKLGITGITAWDATDGTGFLNSDEIHPNEKGYQVIAYFIKQKLIDLNYIEGERDDNIVFDDGNTDDPGEDTPPVESVVVTNAMPEASWGYTVSGLGDNRNEVAVVFTNENANMTWTVPQNLKNVQFLVVGGGGGGGAVNGDTRTAGAGGGGGGVVTGLVASIEKGVSVTVTVGKGGAAGQKGVAVNGHYAAAVSGTDSAFGCSDKFAVTAYGGGGDDGASSASAAVGNAGKTGGSSAGSRPGCGTETQPKSKEGCVVSEDGLIICSEVFGNAGGAGADEIGPFDQYWAAGGGGGATEAGFEATSWIDWDDFDITPVGKGIHGGNGGAGLISDITGETLVYGSGGGGGSGGANELLGGNGGIGAGSGKTAATTATSTTSINALANQGGGGGGGFNEGGSGGSGIVVFRYVVATESPTVDGTDYAADKVFDHAKVLKPVKYPGNPEVATNTVDGVEVVTVTFGGLSDEVPSCYNVTKVTVDGGYQIILAIKDEFKNPIIANSENEDGSVTPAIKVEGRQVKIHLEGTHKKLHYSLMTSTSLELNESWTPIYSDPDDNSNFTFGDGDKKLDDIRFFKVGEVSDEPIVTE